MSTESSESIRDNRRNWMITHRDDYLSSGGTIGHIMDLTAVGGYEIGTHCLVRYRGRKTGRMLITPLCYVQHGGEIAIVASKGGADHHPDWYLNIIERPELEFQVATQAWRGTWRIAEGEERDAVWSHLVACFPFYARYQASTTRRIPVLLLKPREVIPVLTLADADGQRSFPTA